MTDTTTDLDQFDEEILTYDVSDEALEAAAGTDRRAAVALGSNPYAPIFC
jgi:hypothetical protein